jgi:acetyl esterase/lipase
MNMKIKPMFVLLLLIFSCSAVKSQETIPLYPGVVPGSLSAPDEESRNENGEVLYKISKPTISFFIPAKEKANGTAVIICPGGGYGVNVIKREGYEVARKFNELGVAAFVLKYRLPDDKTMKDKSIGPLQDAQQAIKIVRERASEWNIDASRIGIMGFSACGHLASTAGTHFNKAFIENANGTSLRPDFMLLIYPVISLSEKTGHKGTRENLLGKSPSNETVSYFSNEQQVSRLTPPAFLIHAGDDKAVPVENSIMFYKALLSDSVSAGLHIYPEGDHGFLKGFSRDTWMGYCIDWMSQMKLISSK